MYNREVKEMALSDMALASNERREQNIMQLRNMFNQQKVVTLASAVKATGYTANTIKKWCLDGNIPLFIDNDHTVVPLTDKNKPRWMTW